MQYVGTNRCDCVEGARQGRVGHQAQGFVHIAADGQAVNRDLLNNSLRIDDEQTTEGDPKILQ